MSVSAPAPLETLTIRPWMTTATTHLRHLIGGAWTDGDGVLAHSEDPADPAGAPVAEYRTASQEQLEQAMAAAAAAAPGWDQRGLLARGVILRRAAQIMEDRAEELATLMTREQGKSLADSRGEVGATIETLHYHAGAARRPDGTTYPSAHPDEVVRTVRRPVGTVAVITPWNFPLQIPVWKILDSPPGSRTMTRRTGSVLLTAYHRTSRT